jgi:hypothetical protein
VRLFLGVKATPYWLHQTLTFKGAVTDVEAAHGYLKRLLDSLEKPYPAMACFFVREHQQSLGIHFHVIFLFFGQQSLTPEQIRQEFGAAVWGRWNKISGCMLARQANRMTLQQKNDDCIRYLLKDIEPTAQGLPRETHWNGVRRRRLIAANSTPVSSRQLRDYFNLLFPKGPKLQPQTASPAQQKFTKKSLEFMKADLEMQGTYEWADWKRLRAGRRISDDDFLDYLNSERP